MSYWDIVVTLLQPCFNLDYLLPEELLENGKYIYMEDPIMHPLLLHATVGCFILYDSESHKRGKTNFLNEQWLITFLSLDSLSLFFTRLQKSHLSMEKLISLHCNYFIFFI
jgi:hypothetical protein